MKVSLFLLLLFCASAALAQSTAAVGVLSNQPFVLEIPDHSQRASLKPMATPHYLVESSGSTSAQGVRPLWEFPVASQTISLGEAARSLRKQHALDRKAVKVLSDQL